MISNLLGSLVVAGVLSVGIPASAAMGKDSDPDKYSLVLGRIVKDSTRWGECAGDPNESDEFRCWNTVSAADLKVYRRLGGNKVPSKLSLVYISHPMIRDDMTMIFLLKNGSAPSKFVLDGLYSGKTDGLRCLTSSQMQEVQKVGIRVSSSVAVCPDETDD